MKPQLMPEVQDTPVAQEVQSVPISQQASAPFDPQQPLREYVSLRAATPAMGARQAARPAYPGQPALTPAPYPGYAAPMPAQPGYPSPGYPQPGYAAPAYIYPGYGVPASAQAGYGAPTASYPGYGMAAYAYPGYNAPPFAYPGYAQGYAYYPGYGYYPAVPRPKRNAYQLTVAIIALVGAGITILAGVFTLLVTFLVSTISSTRTTPDQVFGGLIVFLALTIVCLVGGGFCVYHCIRAIMQKPSKHIWLPYFWAFLLSYAAALGLGFWLNTQGQDILSPPLKGLLIYLSALLPALTVLALGIRRLRFSLRDQWTAFWRRAQNGFGPIESVQTHSGQWPTSWRRLVLALVSGATLSVVLAGILELIIQTILVGSQGAAFSRALSDPNFSPPPSLYAILLIMLAVVAPIVEEMLKPLAVIILIGRVKSKAEAFALGLACGIGFNLVETTGYISSGTGSDWLNVALVRSGSGLLHGFGAAMVALGWYILTHKEEGRWARRLLLALGCGLYAIIQHAIWNGSVGLVLIPLPGPIGNFFQNGNWTFGVLSIQAYELVNIVELVLMAIFFVFMAGFLRVRPRQTAHQT